MLVSGKSGRTRHEKGRPAPSSREQVYAFVAFADGLAKLVSFKHDPGALFYSLDIAKGI
jgi:hypothetical protein